jgi:DNA-binding NtrC family response regulator
VRELQHCLHRALLFTRGFAIQEDDLLRAIEGRSEPGGAMRPLRSDDLLRTYLSEYLDANSGLGCEPRLLEAVEKQLIVEALRRSKGNQSKAAELLGIPRPTLHAKLQRHGVRTATTVDDGSGTALG